MPAEDRPDPGFDTSVVHPARVYDYWLGGTDNFPAGPGAAERVLAVTPGLRSRVRANRAFLPGGRHLRPAPSVSGLLPRCPGFPRARGIAAR